MTADRSPAASQSPLQSQPFGSPTMSPLEYKTAGASLHPALQAKLLSLEERAKKLSDSNKRIRARTTQLSAKQEDL
jgi:hypothetical protein